MVQSGALIFSHGRFNTVVFGPLCWFLAVAQPIHYPNYGPFRRWKPTAPVDREYGLFDQPDPSLSRRIGGFWRGLLELGLILGHEFGLYDRYGYGDLSVGT